MREIKFRGRDTDGKWHYGDLLRYVRNSYDMIIPAGYANSDDLYDDVVCVDYDTVGQFTGLKDCGGKEIYEGDIVKYFDTDEPWIVGYEVDFGRLIISSAKDKYSNYGAFGLKDSKMVTVIGNVYDSPEQLEADHERD